MSVELPTVASSDSLQWTRHKILPLIQVGGMLRPPCASVGAMLHKVLDSQNGYSM